MYLVRNKDGRFMIALTDNPATIGRGRSGNWMVNPTAEGRSVGHRILVPVTDHLASLVAYLHEMGDAYDTPVDLRTNDRGKVYLDLERMSPCDWGGRPCGADSDGGGDDAPRTVFGIPAGQGGSGPSARYEDGSGRTFVTCPGTYMFKDGVSGCTGYFGYRYFAVIGRPDRVSGMSDASLYAYLDTGSRAEDRSVYDDILFGDFDAFSGKGWMLKVAEDRLPYYLGGDATGDGLCRLVVGVLERAGDYRVSLMGSAGDTGADGDGGLDGFRILSRAARRNMSGGDPGTRMPDWLFGVTRVRPKRSWRSHVDGSGRLFVQYGDERSINCLSRGMTFDYGCFAMVGEAGEDGMADAALYMYVCQGSRNRDGGVRLWDVFEDFGAYEGRPWMARLAEGRVPRHPARGRGDLPGVLAGFLEAVDLTDPRNGTVRAGLEKAIDVVKTSVRADLGGDAVGTGSGDAAGACRGIGSFI